MRVKAVFIPSTRLEKDKVRNTTAYIYCKASAQIFVRGHKNSVYDYWDNLLNPLEFVFFALLTQCSYVIVNTSFKRVNAPITACRILTDRL